MALINKTGITNGGIVQAEHITRAIDALSGGSTDTVSITGSLMGSSSYAVTASYALNGGGGASVSASYAATASFANAINQLPAYVPTHPVIGTIYIDPVNPGMIWIYDGVDWYYFTGSIGTP
jgi:hypothetical protein